MDATVRGAGRCVAGRRRHIVILARRSMKRASIVHLANLLFVAEPVERFPIFVEAIRQTSGLGVDVPEKKMIETFNTIYSWSAQSMGCQRKYKTFSRTEWIISSELQEFGAPPGL